MKNNPRFWLIGGLLGVILLAYVVWMVAVNPVYSSVSQTKQQVTTTNEKTDATVAQTKQLAAQEEDLQQQIDALQRIRAKIPKDVDVPKLMRTIQAEARAEGVELDSLQPGQITLFKVKPTPTPSASDSENNGESQAPAAPAPNPTNLGQGVAPKNTGVAYVPMTLAGQGSYNSIKQLIARLEQQQRAFLVTSLDISRNSGQTGSAGPLTFTMQARVFVLNGDDVRLPADLRTGGE
ncbi:MAG: hypothetical protein IPG68_10925 [Micrococcales bacterium]|nr:hypothetical protein [Micrococcales bacterium]